MPLFKQNKKKTCISMWGNVARFTCRGIGVPYIDFKYFLDFIPYFELGGGTFLMTVFNLDIQISQWTEEGTSLFDCVIILVEASLKEEFRTMQSHVQCTAIIIGKFLL